MSLLPSSPDVSPDSDPRLVGLDSDEAGELMAALSSETARQLLAEEMAVYGPADSPLVIYAGEQERASGLRAALSRLFTGLLALAAGSVAIQELFGRSFLGGVGFGAGGGDAADGNGDGDAQPDAGETEDPETSGGGNGSDEGVQPASGEIEETETETGTATATSEDDVSVGEASPTPEATETPEPTGTSAPTSTKTEEPAETPTATAEPTVTAEPTPTATPTDGGAADNALEVLLGGGLPPGMAFFIGGLTVLSVVVAMTYLRTRP
ncbi:hypothetical protein BRD05_09235 [Halobacteriales archaeon QS_9_70_65]|nr:MAG: hypothetical protein BRD05_09235 [Halobacteriales archaeon QS_9_70_65]